MEFDEFLGSAKWQILEILAKKPSSPIEIAEKINTSVAYVSQQLKILEAVNLVVKEKTGEFKKGKPRSIYSVSKDLVYLTSLIQGSPSKKLIYPKDFQKIILRIWSLDDEKFHYILEKYYWLIENYLSSIEGIYVSEKNVFIVSSNKEVRSLTSSFLRKNQVDVDFKILSKFDSKKIGSDLAFSVYDPNNHLDKLEVKSK